MLEIPLYFSEVYNTFQKYKTEFLTCLYKTVPYKTVPYKTVPYKTVQYKTVRKSMKMNEKTVQYKTVRKTVPINNCFNNPEAENCLLINKHNEQNSDRRSRANVLRACQQRVGLNTKFRAGYCRKAATRVQRAHRRP